MPGLIRDVYAFHTGRQKNWADVTYNFLVDRYGGVWEGRAGSLSGPVKADATGGSQGFAQLCCFIGDHQTEPPTDEARRSMILLLAALADTYAIDTAPGAKTSFVSRGSSRWPRGSSVTASTIAGHRDMSRQTIRPGDATSQLVKTVSRARSPQPASAGEDQPQQRDPVVAACRSRRHRDRPNLARIMPIESSLATSTHSALAFGQPEGHRSLQVESYTM